MFCPTCFYRKLARQALDELRMTLYHHRNGQYGAMQVHRVNLEVYERAFRRYYQHEAYGDANHCEAVQHTA